MSAYDCRRAVGSAAVMVPIARFAICRYQLPGLWLLFVRELIFVAHLELVDFRIWLL